MQTWEQCNKNTQREAPRTTAPPLLGFVSGRRIQLWPAPAKSVLSRAALPYCTLLAHPLNPTVLGHFCFHFQKKKVFSFFFFFFWVGSLGLGCTYKKQYGKKTWATWDWFCWSRSSCKPTCKRHQSHERTHTSSSQHDIFRLRSVWVVLLLSFCPPRGEDSNSEDDGVKYGDTDNSRNVGISPQEACVYCGQLVQACSETMSFLFG